MRQVYRMSWEWERRRSAGKLVNRDEKEPLAHLRHAVVGSIQKCVRALVSEAFESLADFLCEIVPGVIQHVGYVLHHERDRCERLNKLQIGEVEPCAWIVAVRFRMPRYLA